MLERVQKVYFGSWESYYASQTTRPRDFGFARQRPTDNGGATAGSRLIARSSKPFYTFYTFCTFSTLQTFVLCLSSLDCEAQAKPANKSMATPVNKSTSQRDNQQGGSRWTLPELRNYGQGESAHCSLLTALSSWLSIPSILSIPFYTLYTLLSGAATVLPQPPKFLDVILKFLDVIFIKTGGEVQKHRIFCPKTSDLLPQNIRSFYAKGKGL